MSTSTVESFAKFVQAMNLIDVSLKSGNVNCHVPANAVIPNQVRLDHTKSTEVILAEDKSILVCFINFKTNGISKKDDQQDKVLFEMEGTFSLAYAITSPDIDTNLCALFADTNGFFNAYPYIRELFQSFSTRIGIQPVKLPLFKPPTKNQVSKAILEQK